MAANGIAPGKTSVGASVRGDSSGECVLLSCIRELDSAAGLDPHRLSICRSAQLVRAALFLNAAAGEVWPVPQFLHRGVWWNIRSHAGVRLAPRALLQESVVR